MPLNLKMCLFFLLLFFGTLLCLFYTRCHDSTYRANNVSSIIYRYSS